jgi:ribosome-associated protein
MDAIITESFSLPAWLFEVSFSRSSGPGGQNVNKVSSKVHLRFAFEASALPAYVKARIRALGRNQLDADGRLLVVSQKTRDQNQNVEDARDKVITLVKQAYERVTPRRATKPTRGSQVRRLTEKKVRAGHKDGRKRVTDD